MFIMKNTLLFMCTFTDFPVNATESEDLLTENG